MSHESESFGNCVRLGSATSNIPSIGKRRKFKISRRFRRRFRLISLYVIIVFIRIFRELPRAVAFFIGNVLSLVFYIFGGRFRRNTEANIFAAFPDKSKRENCEIIRGVFRNIGKVFIEYILIAHNRHRFSSKFIESDEAEKLINRVLEQGKGALILAAHFGPYELLGHFVSRNFGTHIVVQRLKLAPLYRIIEKWRKRLGFITIDNTQALMMLKVLKKGGSLALLPDIYLPRFRGTYIDFFARKAYISVGPTMLHLATGAPIIHIFILRRKGGYYVKAYDPMVYIPTGDKEKDIHDCTAMWLKTYEDEIRLHPKEWAWFNDRWNLPT